MPQLASLAKVGFYRTPPEALRRLTALFTPAQGSSPLRVIDPCAGEGEALAAMAESLNAEAFAVEVQRDRANACRRRFAHVIWGDAFRLRLSHQAFSLLFLNPPYDRQAAAKGAYEFKFLKQLDRVLGSGGVLVYIVPRDRLAAAATYLSGHYDDLHIWQFPEGEYDAYHQVAVVARKRPAFVKDDATQLRLSQCSGGWGGGSMLPTLPEPGGEVISVPRVPVIDDLLFASADIDADALLATLNSKAAVWAHPSVQQKLWPSGTYRARPLMPLRQGHLALLLAAGYLDNAAIPTPEGRLLVKGKISKDVVVVKVDEENGKRVERERLKVALNVLNADTGDLIVYDGDELAEFVNRYRRDLGEAVVRTFPALYGIEHRAAMPLDFLKRKPLGAQGDVIRALALSVKLHHGTVCVGIPGTGKTFVAAAVSSLVGCARTLVMCPPHLTRKWCREIEMTIPNARAIIIRTPADLDLAMQLPASQSRPVFLVCSREAAKLGFRNRPAAIWRKVRLGGSSGVRFTVERLCCPDCLQPLEDKDGKPLDEADLQGHRAKHLCPHCREMGGHQRVCRVCWPDAPEQADRKFACRLCCGTILQTADLEGVRRQEIARYLAARYRGQIDLFVADEVHECKAGSTAQGRAMGVFASACRKALGLSGTLYSGYASGIFYLLHRLLPEFRAEFRYADETRFIEKYGVFEMTYTKTQDYTGAGSEDLYAETGVVSKRGGERMTRREKPGMSPALLLHVIECAAFLRLEDVSTDLPPYDEQVKVIPLENPLSDTYRDLEGEYAQAAREAGFARKLPVLGSMVQNCLAYPDTCTQPLSVELRARGEVWRTIDAPALPDRMYPKEDALIELARSEKVRGRRSIIYYSNSHTRDLAPRLVDLLRGAGLRARVLTVDVKPELRESWIERRVNEGLDALVINAQLVETGLDLLWFPTVIWHQINYRTTTVRQASRRSWRIGQKQPVMVYHLVYANTVQTAALGLIAKKVHSSNLFDGDLSAGGLNEWVEDESLVALAKQLLGRCHPPGRRARRTVRQTRSRLPNRGSVFG